MEQNGNKISLGLFGVILLAFLLPFATYSCQTVELGEHSGYGLAMGKDLQPKVAENPFAAALGDSSFAGEGSGTATASDRVIEFDPNLVALAALGFAVIGIALSLGANRRRAAVTAAVAAAGALSLIILKSDAAGKFRNIITESQNESAGAGGSGDPMADAMAQGMFNVEMKEGWLLALALFIAAAALNAWLYTRKPAAPAYAAPAPAAPPPYTTTTTQS